MTNKLAEVLRFALENVFDEPNGWYPADIFPDKPGTVDEQIEAGRDEGAARAARSRALIRAAIPIAEAVPAVVGASAEFLAATEALLNWMNGNDLSADHADQCPADYDRLCTALESIQEALRQYDAATTPPPER